MVALTVALLCLDPVFLYRLHALSRFTPLWTLSHSSVSKSESSVEIVFVLDTWFAVSLCQVSESNSALDDAVDEDEVCWHFLVGVVARLMAAAICLFLIRLFTIVFAICCEMLYT